MASQITQTDHDGILTLTMNRPGRGNLMTANMIKRLTDTIAGIEKGEPTRAVVLRGKGKDFCLGRDPGAKPAKPPTAWQMHENVTSLILDAYAAIRRCPIPVIAVVQGHAQGFGSGIAAACDMVLAADTAIFSTPEMKVGIAPTLVMTALQHVHRKALAHLIFSGAPITADTALSVGLVSAVVPEASLEDSAEQLCTQMRAYDVHGIQVIKQFLGKPGNTHPETLSDLADYMLATAFTRPK